MTLEEFYNIFQNVKFKYINNIFSKIYLFPRGMFLFVFWNINFDVLQIFHIIISTSLKRKRIIVYGLVTRYGPRTSCQRKRLSVLF